MNKLISLCSFLILIIWVPQSQAEEQCFPSADLKKELEKHEAKVASFKSEKEKSSAMPLKSSAENLVFLINTNQTECSYRISWDDKVAQSKLYDIRKKIAVSGLSIDENSDGHEVDYTFFSDLAAKNGFRYEAEYFKIFTSEKLGGHTDLVTDQTSCDNGNYTGEYMLYYNYSKAYPGKLNEEINMGINRVLTDALTTSSFCDESSKKIAIKSLKRISQFADQATARRIKERINFLTKITKN